jgi:hypothetical protein
MQYANRLLLVIVATAQLIVATANAQTTASETGLVDFNREIRPILADHCFQCHGPDSASREAGLRLDNQSDAWAELDSGSSAIVPGKSSESELIRRVLHEDDDLRMPPLELNKPVSAADVELLRRWINGGAEYAKHWAFVAPTKSGRYQAERRRGEHPIDYFVRLRHQSEGVKPTGIASRETLIRRLSLDLRGLPPSPEEVDEFLKQTSAKAYESLVEQMLESPSYGERMAVMWLDAARFADTNGYQNDFNRSMWPYRDWVIDAFNANKPYDEFTVEQIAGDLLPGASMDQKIASGFNRNNRTVTEGGSIEEEWLVENVVDRVETTGATFLGLTIGCARCHDHKFDPISQREFYEFFDFFHHVDEKGYYAETRGNVEPKISIVPLTQRNELESWNREIRSLDQEMKELDKRVGVAFNAWVNDITVLATAKPALHFPLDGSKQFMRSTGESGELSSESQPIRVESELGTASEFAGDEWFDAGQVFNPECEKPFSISAWVRSDDSGAIIAKMEKPAGLRGFDVLPFASKFVSVHLISQWPGDAIKVYTTQQMIEDAMNHVVVTYDGSSKAEGVKIYVNGQRMKLTVEKDNLKGSIQSSAPLQIGRRSAGNHYDGLIQDVRCYQHELSFTEVCMLAVEKIGPRFDKKSPKHFRTTLRNAYEGLELDDASREMAKLRAKRSSLAQKRDALQKDLPSAMVMREREEPRDTYVLMRGQYNTPDKSQKVTADVPDCLPAMEADWPKNRLGLARWLVSEANPLTARVFVNRIWEQLFGVGLVKSSENFGFRADLPEHPELLDYLAVEFVQSGWDIKKLLTLIVTSETYRRTSAAGPDAFTRDPENRLLARGPRFRLSAELVRDNALAISGLLSSKIGGPSVKPYQPDGLWDELAGGANGGPYKVAEGEDLYRRGLYTFRKRTVPHPTLSTFDAPSWEFCQVKRAITNTPLQALALMNDTTYVEAARKFAERILTEGGESKEDRLVYAFRICTSRKPRPGELAKLVLGLESYGKHFSENGDEVAEQFVEHGRSSRRDEFDKAELAAYTALASALLNLDETITKE